MRRLPIAGPYGHQRLERPGAGRQRRRQGEGIRPPPPCPDQRALPATVFQRTRLAGKRLQAVVIGGAGVTPVTGVNLVGDVP